MARGFVYLVGAGPGDPELITLRGLRALRRADVVVYDRLVADALLQEAPLGCELIYAGKRAGGPNPYTQDEINALLVEKARQGRAVVRLKGGDPFVFGRGGEEALALARAGVPFEVVPGVTAGVGATALAGIPVTHRGVASSVTFVSGHAPVDPRQGTVVVYMGLERLAAVVGELGRPPSTPAAVIARGSLPDQQVVTGTLADIARRAAHLPSPALLVVGEVVALQEVLACSPWPSTSAANL